MSKEIKLNNSISMDLEELIKSRLLIQANAGGGKSWTIRRILEQSHGKVQHIIIDPEGEFATLREKYDYILVGKGGDTPAESRSAAMLAKKLLELNVSAIIDLYELHPQERKHFVKIFLDAMVNAPKELWHPCLVVIDEIHTFAPEKVESEALGAVIGLASLGRKREYCLIGATQRISKLHKDVAAECNNKLIGRTGLDIDMKRAGDELGFTKREDLFSLRTLDSGNFFAFGPAISKEVIKIKIGDVYTNPPKTGSKAFIAPAPTDKIKSILAKLGDIPQEAKKEAQTIDDLKKEIGGLKKSLAIKNAIPAEKKVVDEKSIKIAVQKAEQVFLGERLNFQKQISDQEKIFNGIRKLLDMKMSVPIQLPIIVKNDSEKIAREISVPGKVIENVDSFKFPSEMKSVTGGAMRMLKVLVSRYPIKLTKSQLATFSKLKPSSGTFSTYISTLKSNGYIYVENDLFTATQDGIDHIGESPNPPQTTDEVITMWRENLTGGSKRMFDVLVERYPEGMTKEEIGEETALSPSSGTFGTYLSILRSNGLIKVIGSYIKIADDIFI